MAVTYVKKSKKKETSGTMADALIADMQEMVPALAEARNHRDNLNNKLKVANQELGEIEKPFLEMADTAIDDDDKKMLLKHDLADVLIAAKAKTRAVKDAEANRYIFETLEEMQPGLGFELMKFGLGDLDKYLAPMQVEKAITHGHAAKRQYKMTMKDNG